MPVAPSASYSLTVRPSIFNNKVVPAVAREVARAAEKIGVAGRRRCFEVRWQF